VTADYGAPPRGSAITIACLDLSAILLKLTADEQDEVVAVINATLREIRNRRDTLSPNDGSRA
jgi:hypothetical protein